MRLFVQSKIILPLLIKISPRVNKTLTVIHFNGLILKKSNTTTYFGKLDGKWHRNAIKKINLLLQLHPEDHHMKSESERGVN